MAEPRAPREYLIAINLGPDQAEHLELPGALKDISGGDFRSMRFGTRGSIVLMRSARSAAQIAGAFAQILLNEDQYLIVEIGQDWWAGENLSAAQLWLKHRVARR